MLTLYRAVSASEMREVNLYQRSESLSDYTSGTQKYPLSRRQSLGVVPSGGIPVPQELLLCKPNSCTRNCMRHFND